MTTDFDLGRKGPSSWLEGVFKTPCQLSKEQAEQYALEVISRLDLELPKLKLDPERFAHARAQLGVQVLKFCTRVKHTQAQNILADSIAEWLLPFNIEALEKARPKSRRAPRAADKHSGARDIRA